MRAALAFAVALSLTGCLDTVATTSTIDDQCAYRPYHDPLCDGRYVWSDGYYGPTHVWIAPHYTRRTLVVSPGYTYRPPVVVNRSVTVVRPAPVVVRPRAIQSTAPSNQRLRMNGRRIR